MVQKLKSSSIDNQQKYLHPALEKSGMEAGLLVGWELHLVDWSNQQSAGRTRAGFTTVPVKRTGVPPRLERIPIVRM